MDLEAKGKDSWECVGELQDTNGTHETGDVGELGNGGADDEGDSPVCWDETDPEELAKLGREGWEVEDFLEDFDINDFDANVSIQGSGNQTSKQVHDVGSCLPVVWRETLHNGIEGVLSLVAVDEETEEHVYDVDEDVGAENALPEVPWVAHLSQEGNEEHSTSIRIDGLIQTVQGADETGTSCGCTSWWRTGISVDRTGECISE